jgi:hypothetical protein
VSYKLFFQKPYSIVSIFYLLERFRFESVIFLHYWVKTINFIECIANYPYPPFSSSTLLSLYSGKRKALRKTHHPRLPKSNNGGGGTMRLGLGALRVRFKS